MKKIYLLALLLLTISLTVCKADGFEQGFVILKNGKRVGGQIKLYKHAPWKNQRYIWFKDSAAVAANPNAKPKKLYAADMKFYQAGTRQFVKVSYFDQAFIKLRNFYSNSWMLERVANGRFVAYMFYSSPPEFFDYFFADPKGDQTEPAGNDNAMAKYRIIFKKDNGKHFVNAYSYNLAKYFKDTPQILEKYQDGKYGNQPDVDGSMFERLSEICNRTIFTSHEETKGIIEAFNDYNRVYAPQIELPTPTPAQSTADLFKPYLFKGNVIDNDTHKGVVGATVSYIDSATLQVVKQTATDETGSYVFNVTDKRPFSIKVEKSGFFTQNLSGIDVSTGRALAVNSPNGSGNGASANGGLANGAGNGSGSANGGNTSGNGSSANGSGNGGGSPANGSGSYAANGSKGSGNGGANGPGSSANGAGSGSGSANGGNTPGNGSSANGSGSYAANGSNGSGNNGAANGGGSNGAGAAGSANGAGGASTSGAISGIGASGQPLSAKYMRYIHSSRYKHSIYYKQHMQHERELAKEKAAQDTANKGLLAGSPSTGSAANGSGNGSGSGNGANGSANGNGANGSGNGNGSFAANGSNGSGNNGSSNGTNGSENRAFAGGSSSAGGSNSGANGSGNGGSANGDGSNGTSGSNGGASSQALAVSGKITDGKFISPEIHLQSYSVDKPMVVNNLLYDYGYATLRPESIVVLDGLVKTMIDNPSIFVELSAHTDSIGSDAFNQKLSQDRAQTCVSYIISKGVDATRITAVGYGKTKPIAPNSLPNGQDNPDGRQLNRRIEFVVKKNDKGSVLATR